LDDIDAYPTDLEKKKKRQENDNDVLSKLNPINSLQPNFKIIEKCFNSSVDYFKKKKEETDKISSDPVKVKSKQY
jgi:hypothetical protein